jgi:hypothetical protein
MGKTLLLESIIDSDRSVVAGGMEIERRSASEGKRGEQMMNSEWKNCKPIRKKEERSFFDMLFCCSVD